MKILITGATGFIGHHVVNELLKTKNTLILTSSKKDAKVPANTKHIPYDLNQRDVNNLFDYFGKPDLVIHLAWEGLPNYKELFHIDKNLFNSYFFLKNLIENGLKNLVVLGTCLEYGMQSGCLSENIETKPVTAYGLAKDILRKLMEELQKKHKFDFKWIRLFYQYGAGQREDSLFSQLNKALEENRKVFNMSGGEQLKDILEIEKVAEYVVKISLQNKETGIFNCCSGKPISIRKFIEDYIKKKNKKIELNLGYYPYPDFEPMAFWGNNEKMKRVIKDDI